MADNVTLPGTGAVIAADDVSSVWYQRVKITDGTADATSNHLVISSRGAALSEGEVAHDAADAGNPQKQGGQARTTNPAAVADADRVNFIADKLGKQITRLNAPRELVTQNTITLSSGTETTLLAAGAAGVFHDLTLLVLSNSSSSDVRVDIRDATAGSVVLPVYLAAYGGGFSLPIGSVPFKQTTAANNWTAQLSSGVSSVYITVQAIKDV